MSAKILFYFLFILHLPTKSVFSNNTGESDKGTQGHMHSYTTAPVVEPLFLCFLQRQHIQVVEQLP